MQRTEGSCLLRRKRGAVIAIVTTIAPATHKVRRARSLSEDSSRIHIVYPAFMVSDGAATRLIVVLMEPAVGLPASPKRFSIPPNT